MGCRFWLAGLSVLLFVVGCAPSDNDASSASSDPATKASFGLSSSTSAIRVNQLGFGLDDVKIAIVSAAAVDGFDVINANDQVVLSGQLSSAALWQPSNEEVRRADFSALRQLGTFRVRVGNQVSPSFKVAEQPYAELNQAAVKAYYFNRASTALAEQHAGRYARRAGHLDQQVLIHASAAGPSRKAGDTIASPGGWYDAGDYNKYIVNAGITTYALLAAFEHRPSYYSKQNLNIPESGNALPDILDEALWGIRWQLTMQDPADGGVYHKLTTAKFAPMVMPHQATEPRYVLAKSTAATLDFAAVMAVTARVFADFEGQLPGFAAQARQAAETAWHWALANPEQHYQQVDEIKTGTYAVDHEQLHDEFAWAAAELFLLTDEPAYLEHFQRNIHAQPGGVPSWDWVEPLAWISLARHMDRVPALAAKIKQVILATADPLVAEYQRSAYRLPIAAYSEARMIGDQEESFIWGSNGFAGYQAMVLIQAHQLSGNRTYRDAAVANLDYWLGRNPLGISYVTGFGEHPVMNLHHRVSESDGIGEPPPGMLSGGPNQSQQDRDDCTKAGVNYPSELPALSFLDHVCSYASNEVAINWNAALVYVSGALDASQVPTSSAQSDLN